MPVQSIEDPIRLIVGFGYLARPVAERWLGQGARVLGTTRKHERFAELDALGVEPVRWDVLEPGEESLPAADVVLYCVGLDRSAGASARAVYVDGLRNTLERLPAPRRLIYVSSTGVYGDFGGEWVDEDSPIEPADPVGQACLEAEQTLQRIAKERSIPTVVLRLAGLYGPGRMIGADAVRQGRPIAGDPDAWLNLIHVSDAANVVEAVRACPEPSPLYVVSDGRPTRRREFYAEVARLLGACEPRFAPADARRRRGDRRVRNRRMLAELQPQLDFPDYRAGLRQCLSSGQSG